MIKIALIGVGRMAKIHYNAYKNIPDVKVTTAVDVDIDAAAKRINDPDVTYYDNLDSMLEKEQIDIADICSPSYLHAEHAIKTMNKGIHTLCEKPISIHLEKAREMVAAANRNNVFFLVAQVIRFLPEYVYLKKVYDEKTFGGLNQISFNRVGEMTKTSWQDWMRDITKSGMSPVDLHIHDVDFILHMIGKPNSVVSFLKQDGKKISRIYTHYDYNFDKDIMVEAEGVWYDPAFPFSMSYRASFDEAILEYKSNKLMLYRNNGDIEQIYLEEVKTDTKLNVGSVNGYQYEIDYFVNCVRNKTKPERITPEESLLSLEVVLKELDSANERKRIIL